MRPFDFAPLYRTTVGFDRLFDMVDNSGRPDWPPYNIEKKDENEYRISMAIAGFGTDDIELTQNGNELTVVGQKQLEEHDRQILHQGLAHAELQAHIQSGRSREGRVRIAGERPAFHRPRSRDSRRAQASAHRDQFGRCAG